MTDYKKTEKTDKTDVQSGNWIERLIFKNRAVVLVFCVLVTLFLGYHAGKLQPDASFLKMIPLKHPYLVNFLKYRNDLKGLGNAVRIAVETTQADIFSKDYMETLQKINDEIFYLPGVDRIGLKSLWTAQTRWREVTEQGFDGGPVIPDTYDGSEESLKQLRLNVMKSGEIGTLVANKFTSSIVYVPVMDIDPRTGERLNYPEFSRNLEEIRTKYQSDTIRIHITGFAKLVGDLIEGANQIKKFFLVTIVITFIMLFAYFRTMRSALAPLVCAIVGVVWQLGLLRLLGFGIDPYSMLVPFLIFAIAVSHGVQIVNAIQIRALAGAEKILASRLAFRDIWIPCLIAMLTGSMGFATLLVIQIQVIQDLAIGASIGVAVLVFTSLVLIPVMVSYLGISPKTLARRREDEEEKRHGLWLFFSHLTRTRLALVVIAVVVALYGWGLYAGSDVKIGDLDKGAPELRPNSRYNQDNDFMTSNYSASSDVFVVMIKTPEQRNYAYHTLVAADRLQSKLEGVEGVQATVSLVNFVKLLNGAFNEGNMKWMALSRSETVLRGSITYVPPNLVNKSGTISPILIFLNDHKADTLKRVVDAVETFAAENNSEEQAFLLAAGNSGIEASTNIVIEVAEIKMLVCVYGVVILLCLITFRSVRAVICIVVPLALTSVLCNALMMYLGIGIKVATLPVIALGVGVGVDYAIYIYSRFKKLLSEDLSLFEAYYQTLKSTGKAVILTGLSLTLGVATWAFSPIKFQADMGLLMAFMFLGNMIGAIVILPAMLSLMFYRRSGSATTEKTVAL